MDLSDSHVLIVDDDGAIGTVLAALLGQAGMTSTQARNGQEAVKLLETRPCDAVLTDLRMPGMDGMDLLRTVTSRWPGVPVVMITAHGTVQLAVEAMRAGAADFVLKPFEREEIVFVLRKALALSKRAEEAELTETPSDGEMVFESKGMREVDALVTRAASGTTTILVRGETGTGKELVARAIHNRSPRRDKPFVKVHCAALPDTLLEAELFGYERGAFTGAVTRKPGRVELAEGGTLFLDEIGDITAAMQVKLLRILQDREYERLGGTKTNKADLRFVAATHRDLEAMVARGEFREDLLYRLNVITVWLPPLRLRPDDIERLVRHFSTIHGKANGKVGLKLDADAVKLLSLQPWPGNVRQLGNCIERLVVLSDGLVLDAADVAKELGRPANPFAQPASAPARDEATTMDARRGVAEREALVAALQGAAGNRTVAARILGISRRTLYNKLAEHKLV
jgi:two-component system, NtrC family, response regulator AtoC